MQSGRCLYGLPVRCPYGQVDMYVGMVADCIAYFVGSRFVVVTVWLAGCGGGIYQT